MVVFRKRYLLLIALIAAVGYGSQYYTIGGWHHLRLEPRTANTEGKSTMGGDIHNPQSWGVTSGNSTAGAETAYHASKSHGSNQVVANSSLRTTPIPHGPSDLGRTSKWVSAQVISNGGIPTKSINPTVRIASFNLQSFGESKANKIAVMEIVARLVRNFDVVAVQDISARQRDILPRLIDRINQSDRRYDYCIGPRVGPPHQSMHFAFIFDTERIETDRYQLYTVDDPSDRLDYEPLVGWFRSRQANESEAFTFSLVNVLVSPSGGSREIQLLPDLIKSIRQDGRGEDDIIIAGDFGCGDSQMASLRNMGMLFALEGVATTISGDEMLDNIIFPSRATDEFTGRSGTVDFLRQYNLTPDQASQVSNHMPVWCEFFANEGGQPGYRPE
ncbi:MAG: endonuclease/exonuclease/phosphatase family protein [Pirellula sp.]